MKKKAKQLISQYYINYWGVNPEKEYEVEFVDAKQFIKPDRIDLMAKLEYIDSVITGKNVEYAKELYAEHLRAFTLGTYIEAEKPEKNSLEKYLNCFNEMIRSIPKEGFDANKSVVGVSTDGNILDGSHRTAIAIYFNLLLPIIHIERGNPNNNYLFFKKLGLREKYLDYMTYKMISYMDNVYVACLYPIATETEKDNDIQMILNKDCNVIYKKEVYFNFGGLHNLMIHAYGNGGVHDSWVGNEKNGFSGLIPRVKCSYSENKKTVFYFLTSSSLENVIKTKKQIRELFPFGPDSIHITDTKDEAIILSQVVLNDNSLDVLNYGEPFKYTNFVNKISAFKNILKQNQCDFSDYAIDSSSILSIYGLREADDIDYLTKKDDMLPKSGVYENHSTQLRYYNKSIDALIYHPDNYFFFRELKYISIKNTEIMKKNRDEEKDKRDLTLIRNLKKRRKIAKPEPNTISEKKKYIKRKYGDNKLFSYLLRIYRKMKL